MLITKDYLKRLSPCEARLTHYLEFYKDWSGTLEEFLDLPELTHEDKKWVFFRFISKDNLRLIAADFAERVLHLFENKYPNDDRPRKAIEATRNGNITDAAAYAASAAAAYAAARATDAYAAAAASAADAAADAYAASATDAYAAAASAADAAADASAAAYADAYAASAAIDAIDAADAARLTEEKAQVEIMKKYARESLKEIE